MSKKASKRAVSNKYVYLYTYVAKEQRDDFTNIAKKKRMSQSSLMRTVLDAFIAAENKPAV